MVERALPGGGQGVEADVAQHLISIKVGKIRVVQGLGGSLGDAVIDIGALAAVLTGDVDVHLAGIAGHRAARHTAGGVVDGDRLALSIPGDALGGDKDNAVQLSQPVHSPGGDLSAIVIGIHIAKVEGALVGRGEGENHIVQGGAGLLLALAVEQVAAEKDRGGVGGAQVNNRLAVLLQIDEDTAAGGLVGGGHHGIADDRLGAAELGIGNEGNIPQGLLAGGGGVVVVLPLGDAGVGLVGGGVFVIQRPLAGRDEYTGHMGQLALAGLIPDLLQKAVPKVQLVGNLHVQRPDGGLLVGADGDGDRHLIAAAHRGGDGGGAGAPARHAVSADLGDVGVGGLPDHLAVFGGPVGRQLGQANGLVLLYLQLAPVQNKSADINLDSS